MDGEFGLTVQKSDKPVATLGWRLAEWVALLMLLYSLASNQWLMAGGAALALIVIYALWRWLHPWAGGTGSGGGHDADSGGDSGGD